jgi:hypothetical protein
MGSLLSEGDHLYLDRDADWKGAVALLLEAVGAERERCQASTIVLRDLPAEDREMERVLKGAGFIRVELPDSLVIDVDWADRDQFLARLSKRARKFQRERVMPWDDAYQTELLRKGGRRPSDPEWSRIYALYQNVRRRNLALNTFALPENLFRRMLEFSSWEILLLKLRPEFGGDPDDLPQGFIACYAGPEHYAPLLAGMDYPLVESHGLYRQLISQAVRRAEQRGAKRIPFGMGAELEKIRFGARRVKRAMYVQSHDQFHYDVLSLIASDPDLRSDA